jgi:hypothetical protein
MGVGKVLGLVGSKYGPRGEWVCGQAGRDPKVPGWDPQVSKKRLPVGHPLLDGAVGLHRGLGLPHLLVYGALLCGVGEQHVAHYYYGDLKGQDPSQMNRLYERVIVSHHQPKS